jgi:hypothetical protein
MRATMLPVLLLAGAAAQLSAGVAFNDTGDNAGNVVLTIHQPQQRLARQFAPMLGGELSSVELLLAGVHIPPDALSIHQEEGLNQPGQRLVTADRIRQEADGMKFFFPPGSALAEGAVYWCVLSGLGHSHLDWFGDHRPEARTLESPDNGQSWMEYHGHRMTLLVTLAGDYAPVIVQQPRDLQALPGEEVTLRVKAAGSEPMYYMWFKGQDGDPTDPFADHVGDSLTIAAEYTESYWVRVSNAFGYADSRAARVEVVQPLPPVFAAAPGIQLAQTARAYGVPVGEVSHQDFAPGDLYAYLLFAPRGLSVSNIRNDDGRVSADFAAAADMQQGSHLVYFGAATPDGDNAWIALPIKIRPNRAPYLGMIEDQSAPMNGAVTIRLEVFDEEQPAQELNVAVSVDNVLLLDPVGGVLFSDDLSELILRPESNHVGGGRIKVVVTDAGGLSAEAEFRLEVGEDDQLLRIRELPILEFFTDGSLLRVDVDLEYDEPFLGLVMEAFAADQTLVPDGTLWVEGAVPDTQIVMAIPAGLEGETDILVRVSQDDITASMAFRIRLLGALVGQSVGNGGGTGGDQNYAGDALPAGGTLRGAGSCTAGAMGSSLAWLALALAPALARRRRR